MTWTGQRLRDARARAGITSQQEAADRIGVSVRAYAAWERDEAKPQAHWLPHIETVLGNTHTDPTQRLDQDTIEQALEQASFLDLLAALARKHSRTAKNDPDAPDLPTGRFEWRTEDTPSARRARGTIQDKEQPDEPHGGRVL